MELRYPDKTIIIGKTEYVFYFFVIIFLGSAMVLTRNSLEAFGGFDITTIVGKTFMFFFAIHIFYKHGNSFRSSIPWNIVFILLIWAFLQVVKYNFFSFYVLMRLMNLFFAVVIIKVYGQKNIYLFEHVVSKLSVISIIGWMIVLVMPNLMLDLASLSPFEQYGLVQNGSFFIFGIADSTELVRRNLGFAWEPGRFGSILCIGLFFNLIAYQFKIKGNKNFWYILLAILSSQSTTAYMSMFFVIFVCLYNKRKDLFFKMIPFFIILFLFLVNNLEFMGAKIQSLWLTEEHKMDWERQLDYYATQDGYLVPQRFDGLFYEILNILHDPLIGNASDEISYLDSIFNIKFSLCNGCLRIFANMGIIMGLLYYIMLYKSSLYMKSLYHYQGGWAWFVLFVLINISYSWIFEPVFLAVILLYMYEKTLRYESVRINKRKEQIKFY